MQAFCGRMSALVLVVGLVACGSDESEPEKASAAEVTVVARDYSFEVPATIRGGLVEVSLRNAGGEPHFVDIASMTPQATLPEVKAALSPPPGSPVPAGSPGPALFERFAGVSTMEPGRTGKVTVNLPAGRYAFFCRLPSPDGIRHVAKGMISEVTVTDEPAGEPPEAAGTIVAVDFAYGAVPALHRGTNIVRLRNEGRQFHEINLVEINEGSTIEDVVAWFKRPAGASPIKSLGGGAIRPGHETSVTLELETGSSYAFVCGIPDLLGDRALHVTKGMFSAVFTP
jgi:uncharacterized cupredoxin-like copper-binding protein